MGERVRGSELSGRRVELSDGRFVFVGRHPKYPDETGIVMRNGKGDYTSFRLSDEAVSALRLLLSDPESGVTGSPPAPESPPRWGGGRHPMTYRSPVYTGFVIALALFAIGGRG